MNLTIHIGRLTQVWKIQHISLWVPYAFGPPLKVIIHTTFLYSVIRRHWGWSWIMFHVLCLGLVYTYIYKREKRQWRHRNFNRIGVMACTNRIMKAEKGHVPLPSNNTFFSDIWFIGVKISEEESSEGVDYWSPVKTIPKGLFLAMLEKLMKEWPGGSRLVMKSTPIFPGDIPFMTTEYKYKYQNILGFIATDGVWKYWSRLFLFISFLWQLF